MGEVDSAFGPNAEVAEARSAHAIVVVDSGEVFSVIAGLTVFARPLRPFAALRCTFSVRHSVPPGED